MTGPAMPSCTISLFEQFWRFAWKVLNTDDLEDIKTSTCNTDDLAKRPIPKKLIFSFSTNLLSFVRICYSFNHLWEYQRFPYKEDQINEWFVQEFASGEGEKKAVNVINVDQDGRRRKSYTQGQVANFPESLANEQLEVFFHGTNHMHAVNIIASGILLTRGKEAQDFSDSNGFYVTSNFREADARARELFKEKQAVLIYLVDRKEFRGDNGLNGLDLRENKREWLQVVQEFRCGGKINRKFRKEISKEYDYIEGPQARWSEGSSHPRAKEGSHALCVRSARCVQLFNGSLCRVIFFER